MKSEVVTIDRLGAHGDGVAHPGDGASVYVPFTLPGETVRIERSKDRVTPTDLLEPAADRVAPPCPHFGLDGRGDACGGCSLQHMAGPAYADWKRGLVVEALAMQGLTPEIAPLVRCAPRTRRRMTLTARRTQAGVLLGFNRTASHTIVDIETCLIGDRRIVGKLAALRAVAAAVCATGAPFRMTVLASETGFDIAVEGSGKLSADRRQAAIACVLGERSIARLTVDGETLVEARKPVVLFGDVSVVPPPGAFVQAVAAAETEMADKVVAHLSSSKKVADLFAGCGSFALRLARHASVHAAEADGRALAALDAGFRKASGLKTVTGEGRDLYRRPLMTADLKSFDGLVFDPPRAGAETQAGEMARSSVARIAAVSCNPVTLARDLAILVSGGYRIEAVYPIDQFLWSGHVEAVALLSRT